MVDVSPRPAPDRCLQMARWLFAVAFVVVVMVVVGGITRLTESGLSITEWKPVTGAIPPLNDAEWEAEFALYRQIGEYKQVSGPAGMTLADYKFIYFWEWFHRLLGRFIGLIYALPLAWFWVKGAIPGGYKPRLLGLLALGALQGTFGWYMVRSGLSTQVTDVSHFWLSIHLLTALFTLAGLIWTGARSARIGAGCGSGTCAHHRLRLGREFSFVRAIVARGMGRRAECRPRIRQLASDAGRARAHGGYGARLAMGADA